MLRGAVVDVWDGLGTCCRHPPLAPAILIGGQEIIREVSASLKNKGLLVFKILEKGVKKCMNIMD